MEKVVPLLSDQKVLVDKLRNFQRSQFIDTFYELEVGCSLMDAGFEVDFEGELTDDGNTITPNIVITNENVIVEIKTLHESLEAKKGRKSNMCFDYDEIRRVKNPLCKELDKYKRCKISQPLVVIFCPDMIAPPLVSTLDLDAYFLIIIAKSLFWVPFARQAQTLNQKGMETISQIKMHNLEF